MHAVTILLLLGLLALSNTFTLPLPGKTGTCRNHPTTTLNSNPEPLPLLPGPSSLAEFPPSHLKCLPPSTSELATHSLVSFFRESGTYIARHQSRTFVIHLPGTLISDETLLSKICDDIALLWLLGMKLVLVVGCRAQISRRMKENGQEWVMHDGVRITDETVLRLVKEEAGYGRFEVERNLARALKNAGQGVQSKSDDSTDDPRTDQTAVIGGNVVSGNFVVAQPLGVRSGVDYQYTGIPRRVEVNTINRALDSKDIVLLTSLGASPSGELFNVASESLASVVAGAVRADKVIFFLTEPGNLHLLKESEMKQRNLSPSRRGKMIQSLRLSHAKTLLNHHNVTIKPYSVLVPATNPGGINKDSLEKEMLEKIGWCFSACSSGVKRAHLISPFEGSLLLEMFTRDGSGTMISRDLYDGIRRASVDDISGIFKVIEPLVVAGNLVKRPRDMMEKEISTYYVYTRDDMIVACGQIRRWGDEYAEIGCLVVHEDYRKSGRGDAMLSYLERLCVESGARKVFVMSTVTMGWFLERGFKQTKLDILPAEKRASIKAGQEGRNSKVFFKEIRNERELDTEELIWDR